MSNSCLFCRILTGEIPAKRVYDDERSIAFVDINPQAPVHLLIVPREHLASLEHSANEDAGLLGHLLRVGARIAREQGLCDGYRIVINTGADGGQTVDHLHLHLLGGRPMSWPPG